MKTGVTNVELVLTYQKVIGLKSRFKVLSDIVAFDCTNMQS